MSSEYPHSNDIPFTVQWIDLYDREQFTYTRASSPDEAVTKIRPDMESLKRLLNVIEGHPTIHRPDSTQLYQLRAGEVPKQHHDILSLIASGDDSIGLLNGFIQRENVTFVVHASDGDDGYMRIAPLLMTIPESQLTEIRDMDGMRLDTSDTDS